MFNPNRILLASHGTAGARAADALALSLCDHKSELFHLVVVPDLWRGMMGDDWLNNASTRDAYGRHVETQLAREIDQHRGDLERDAAARGVPYRIRVVIGKPAGALIEFASEIIPGVVVIGSPRPPRTPGLRSRMVLEELVRGLSAPLLVAPYPG